jgi:hypothetical protein
MDSDTQPAMLELAPLPREQIGPFLLLGLDKDASATDIEAHWAERIKEARRRQIAAELGDINWAREVLNDVDQRIQADVGSLNADTSAGFLARLGREFGIGQTMPWQPLELEESMAAEDLQVTLPSAGEVLAELKPPSVPWDIPAVPVLLKQFVELPVDPWAGKTCQDFFGTASGMGKGQEGQGS